MCSPGGGEERCARGQPFDDVNKTSLRRISRHDVTKISLRVISRHNVTRTSRGVTRLCLDRISVYDFTTSSYSSKDHDVIKTSYNRVNGYDITDIQNKPYGTRPHNACGHQNHLRSSYHKGLNSKTSEDCCCCRQRCTIIKSSNRNTSSCCSSNYTNSKSSHNTALSINRRANKRNRSSSNSHTRSPLIVSRLKLDPRPQHPLLLLLLLLLACSSSSSTARGPFVAAHCEKGVKFFNDQLGVCEPCSKCLPPYIKIIPCYEYQDTTCAIPGDYFEVKGREGSRVTSTAVQEEGGQDDSLERRRGDGGGGRRGTEGGGRNNAESRGKKRTRVRNHGRKRGGKNRNNRNRGNRGRNNDDGRRENPNHWGSQENRLEEEELPRPNQDSDDSYLRRNGHSNFESDVGENLEADQKHWEVYSTEAPREHSADGGSIQSPVAQNTTTSISASPKPSDFLGSPATAAANSTENIISKASVHEAGSAPGQGNSSGLDLSYSPVDSRGAGLPPSSTTEDEDASFRLSVREMVSSGWTAAVVVCAALLLGLLAIALLLLLGLHLLIHIKNKIVSHLKEKLSEEDSRDGSDHACPSTAALMHQSPSSLSSSPSCHGKLPKKPKKLGRGLGRVPSGKVRVARTYKPAPGGRGDKLDSSNSSFSGCAMRQSTSTVLTSADTFLSGGSDGTFCAETTLMSETSSGRHGDFITSAKETSFCFGGKETIFRSKRDGGKESSFGFVSNTVTPADGPHARWSSRSSSTPNTASLWSAKQHDDKLLAATLPLVGGGHGTQPAPMQVVNSVVTNNIVTFVDGSTVSTTTNYSANAADGDHSFNYPYAHTLPTTYIRTSTRTQALLNSNNSNVGGAFNGSIHGSPGVGPSVGLISGGPHPTAEPIQTLTSVSEAKGSPIPYTMDKLLEQRRRLGCTSSVDTNIYVEMWRGSSAAPSNATSAAPSPALHRSNIAATTGGRGSTFTPLTGGPLDRSARHTSDDQRTAFVTAVQRDLNNLSINNSGYNSNSLAQGNAGLNDSNCGGDRVAAEGGNLGNGGPLVSVGRSATNSPALQRHPALGGGNHAMGVGNHAMGVGNHAMGVGNHGMGGGNQGIAGAKLCMVGGNHITGNTKHVLANNINHTVGNSAPGYEGAVVGGATGSPSVHAGRLNDRLTAHLNSVPASGRGIPASPGPALRRHLR